MDKRSEILIGIFLSLTLGSAGTTFADSRGQGRQERGLPCRDERSLQSNNASTPSSISFVNRTSQPVQFYWLDYSGQRKLYGTVAPGDAVTQATYLSHPWVVTNTSGLCLGIYLPPASAIIRDAAPVPAPQPPPRPAPPPPPAGGSPSFLHAPNGDYSQAHPDTIINYVTWDGSNWTAKFVGNRFVHAPNGDWSRAHTDVIMNYTCPDGSRWTAKLVQGRFLHAPQGDFSQAHPDDVINYKTWDGSNWWARLVWSTARAESEKEQAQQSALDGTRDRPGKSCRSLHERSGISRSGVYWVKPTPGGEAQETYCEMTLAGGGWMLVARLAGSGPFPSWDFDLQPGHSAGTYRPDPSVDENFYRSWSAFPYSQLLLTTTNQAVWLVTDKVNFTTTYANDLRTVSASSASPNGPVQYRWYFRGSANPEDPWVSVGDHIGQVLYGESSFSREPHVNTKNANGGVGIYVR